MVTNSPEKKKEYYEAYREQGKENKRIRSEALRRLREMHYDEYDVLRRKLLQSGMNLNEKRAAGVAATQVIRHKYPIEYAILFHNVRLEVRKTKTPQKLA